MKIKKIIIISIIINDNNNIHFFKREGLNCFYLGGIECYKKY